MQTKFNSSTPTDIDSVGLEKIVDYLNGAEGDANVASPSVRLNLALMLYDVLGLTLTPDIALATVAEPPATLVISTAGGGKTTWAQVKAILEKLMRKSVYHPGKKIQGSAVLCLVYNKHNVQDMKDKHRDMVARLRARNIKGLDIDDEIHACTMHSFCDFWRREYVARMDLLGATLLEQNQAESFMRRAIRIACKKMGMEREFNHIDPAAVLELYMFYRETMCTSISELAGCDKYIDLAIDDDIISCIFERYDASKKLQHKYDFVDMLYKFYCLLRDDEQVRSRVQKYYEYVIADEVQDFTPIMWEILKLMCADGTPLTCIGDDDQNIYYFRGADISSTLNFTKEFTGGKVYTLEYNRRCGKRILDEARNIIQMNTLRFNKVLRNTRDGGSVIYEPYNSLNGQYLNVLKEVKNMSPEEQSNTVICYRDGSSATILTDMLMSEDIIFNVISGVGPFQHELYRHLFAVFTALEMPYDMASCLALHKVLPCNKEEFYSAIGFDPAKGRFVKENQRGVHFKDYDYGKLNDRKSFTETIKALAELSFQLESRPVSELVVPVFTLLNKYFWSFKKSQYSKHEDIDELMQARVLKYFQSPLLYKQFFIEYQQKRNRYQHYTETREGLTVSTFHSLKGLEFKNVIVVCMDDELYPNFSLINSKGYSDTIKQKLKEAEVRLWYVAVTRAKDNLKVYYSKQNPSLFVQYALSDCFPLAGKFPDATVNEKNVTNTLHPQKILLDANNDFDDLDDDEADTTDFSSLNDLDDLDDFDIDVSQGNEIQESSTKNLQDIVVQEVPQSRINETVNSAPTPDLVKQLDSFTVNSSASISPVQWESTQKLVQDTKPSETPADKKEDIVPDSAAEAESKPVQLQSGKSLYINRLLNSL